MALPLGLGAWFGWRLHNRDGHHGHWWRGDAGRAGIRGRGVAAAPFALFVLRRFRGGRGAVVFQILWLHSWRAVVQGVFDSRSWDKAVRERVNRDSLGHRDTLKHVILVGHLVDDGMGVDGRLHRRLPALRGFGAK